MKDKVFEVAYMSRDKIGLIVKTIKVVETTSKKAVNKVMELKQCTAIYGATESASTIIK